MYLHFKVGMLLLSNCKKFFFLNIQMHQKYAQFFDIPFSYCIFLLHYKKNILVGTY